MPHDAPLRTAAREFFFQQPLQLTPLSGAELADGFVGGVFMRLQTLRAGRLQQQLYGRYLAGIAGEVLPAFVNPEV